MLLPLFLSFLLFQHSQSANILGVILHTSYSHQLPFRPLWRELAARGHNVTVLTTDPMNENLTNLREIDLSPAYEAWRSTDIIEYSEKEGLTKVIEKLKEVGQKVIEVEMEVPEVRELLGSEEANFDLVIAEFYYPISMAFSSRFNCPLILAQSADLTSGLHELVGNPNHILQYPTYMLRYDHPLKFSERLASLIGYFAQKYVFGSYLEHYDKIAKKYFGEDLPPLHETMLTTSLIISNSNPVFSNMRPQVPGNVVMGGGIHIQPPKPLPEDLKQFLDAATEGVVYFSLGSNVFSANIASEKQKVILETLSELPFKVIWKFEAEDLEGKPDNVKLVKWVPQQDVLRHPNVKVFITQGGFQSIEEAIYTQVPVVVMPKIADQFFNAKRAVNKGMGLSVEFSTLTKEEFKEAILEVATNAKYRERVKELAELAVDQPMTGLQRAVWWTEYVLRHNDTSHLKAPWATRRFYHEFQLDVVAVLFAGLLGLVLTLYHICRIIVRVVIEACKSKKMGSGLRHSKSVGFRLLINKVAK